MEECGVYEAEVLCDSPGGNMSTCATFYHNKSKYVSWCSLGKHDNTPYSKGGYLVDGYLDSDSDGNLFNYYIHELYIAGDVSGQIQHHDTKIQIKRNILVQIVSVYSKISIKSPIAGSLYIVNDTLALCIQCENKSLRFLFLGCYSEYISPIERYVGKDAATIYYVDAANFYHSTG